MIENVRRDGLSRPYLAHMLEILALDNDAVAFKFDIFDVDIDVRDFGGRSIWVYNPVFSLMVALVAVFLTIMVMVPRLSGISTEG